MQCCPVGGTIRHDHGLKRGRREVTLAGAPRSLSERVADLDVAQPPHLGDLPGCDRSLRRAGLTAEDADRRDLAIGGRTGSDANAVPGAQEPGVHPHVSDLLASGRPFHLEYAARDRATVTASSCGQQLGDPGSQAVDTRASHRRPEEHRMHDGLANLAGEAGPQARVREAVLILHVVGEHGIVPLGEYLRKAGAEVVVACAAGYPASVPGPEVGGGAHRYDGGGQFRADVVQDALVAGPGAVDLVHKDQRRDAEPGQRTHQNTRLRLHALDRRDNQNCAVEHAEHPFHLGDEVGVTRRVDQVDCGVTDRERNDG